MTANSRQNRPASARPPKMAQEEATRAAHVATKESQDRRVITTFGGLFLRAMWFFAGPAALLLTLYGIAHAGSGWATVLDAVFFVVVGLMVWCRWIEQQSGRGTTVYGGASTWADFRRYVKTFLPLAVLAWLAANLLGNHLFNGGSELQELDF
jgi:hypothetical protein